MRGLYYYDSSVAMINSLQPFFLCRKEGPAKREKSNMRIKKNTRFKLNSQEVVASRDIHFDLHEKGCFILNMWSQCSFADINVLPVDYVGNLTEQDMYMLKKDNVIVGETKDICLK